jgi:Ca2+-binding EF-hand superfamily protein
LAKKKAEAFYKIFTILDSDNDGKISAQLIDITRLDLSLLEVMSPLFIEIEELG